MPTELKGPAGVNVPDAILVGRFGAFVSGDELLLQEVRYRQDAQIHGIPRRRGWH